MSRIFNNIRQRLLAQNRFTRYLIYAVGEIVLVVIGILIALQLNNWNEREQVRQLEIKYLREIANNLRSDSVDIAFNIEFNEIRFRSGQMVLKALDGNTPYSDTLDQYFGNLLYTTRSVMNYSAYETLKSRGLEIISNDSLRMMITRLYSFSYRNVIDFEMQDDHAFQYQVVMPAVLEKVLLLPPKDNPRMAIRDGRPLDFERLKSDDEFKNAIKMNNELRAYMLSNYMKLAEDVAGGRKSIEAEFKNLKN